MNDFFRFPSTPHLAWLGAKEPREDKVLSDLHRESFLNEKILVEEKVDGANVGISWCHRYGFRVQNRGSYILAGGQNHSQFNALWPWLYERQHLFEGFFPKSCVVFGEWCALKHSQHYKQLPDWFIGFDVYDKRMASFYSSERRNELFKKLRVVPVAQIKSGQISMSDLINDLDSSCSAYGNPKVEGFYLRVDDVDWLDKRAKLVRADFIQSIQTHWKKKPLVSNIKVPEDL